MTRRGTWEPCSYIWFALKGIIWERFRFLEKLRNLMNEQTINKCPIQILFIKSLYNTFLFEIFVATYFIRPCI